MRYAPIYAAGDVMEAEILMAGVAIGMLIGIAAGVAGMTLIFAAGEEA